MKKSLEELQARSGLVVLMPKFCEIALKAKSPTDACRLASACGFDPVDIEAVRYLAMIKRDYGLPMLRDFIEKKNNFVSASSFLDRVTIALTYLDFCQSVPSLVDSELSLVIAELLKDVRSTFDLYFSNTILTSKTEMCVRCQKRIEMHGDCARHVEVMFSRQGFVFDRSTLEKASLVLFNVGLAVAERYGLYFMRSLPMHILRNHKS